VWKGLHIFHNTCWISLDCITQGYSILSSWYIPFYLHIIHIRFIPIMSHSVTEMFVYVLQFTRNVAGRTVIMCFILCPIWAPTLELSCSITINRTIWSDCGWMVAKSCTKRIVEILWTTGDLPLPLVIRVSSRGNVPILHLHCFIPVVNRQSHHHWYRHSYHHSFTLIYPLVNFHITMENHHF